MRAQPYILGMTFGLCLLLMPSSFARIEHEKAWVDVPDAAEAEKAFSGHGWSQEIMDSLRAYHSFDKSSVSALDDRIRVLAELSEMLGSLGADLSVRKRMVKLAAMADKKAWYLRQLQELYARTDVNDRFTDSSSELNQMVLVNSISYDFNLPTAWGLYWLEALDPSHRLMLTPYYLRWEAQNTNIPFFMWLEEQDVPFYSPEVDYFSNEEILDARASLDSSTGVLRDVKGEIIHTANDGSEYIYVLSAETGLLIAKGSEEVRHTSLSRGRPIIGAGSLKVREGRITHIDVESGHYQPSAEDLVRIVSWLENHGALISPDQLRVKYYEPSGAVVKCSYAEVSKNRTKAESDHKFIQNFNI